MAHGSTPDSVAPRRPDDPGRVGAGPDQRAATAFERATSVRPTDDPGTWAWAVPDGWQQGRGAYGGLPVAAAVRAVERQAADADPGTRLRSMSVEILAPVPVGDTAVTVTALRRGSSVAAYDVAVRADAAPTPDAPVLVHAAVTRGADRVPDLDLRSAPWGPPPAPVSPSWADVPVVPVEAPFGPVFGQHVEFRPVSGLPLQGRPEDVLAWVRFRDRDESRPYDEAQVAALADAAWPVTLVALATMRPLVTLTFTLDLLVDPATLDPRQPLLHHGRLVAGDAGYLVEIRQLWAPDGRLVTHNVQTMAIIR
ncbi:MAG: thioesterase family protein [Candidatus Nanopelagicales bacterium]